MLFRSTALIGDELANGTLVTLFDTPLDTEKSYWLIEANRLSSEAEIFRDWLVAASTVSRDAQKI